jgi:hypothetical protein
MRADELIIVKFWNFFVNTSYLLLHLSLYLLYVIALAKHVAHHPIDCAVSQGYLYRLETHVPGAVFSRNREGGGRKGKPPIQHIQPAQAVAICRRA